MNPTTHYDVAVCGGGLLRMFSERNHNNEN